MDPAASFHDIISLLHEDSEERSNEEENTLNIMALFEIDKPLQSAIIFESDNESNYSSSENDFKTNKQTKHTEECCSKPKKIRTIDERSNLDIGGEDLNRINKKGTLNNKESNYFQEDKKNMFNIQSNVQVKSCFKKATTGLDVTNAAYLMSDTQKVVKTEIDFKELNTNVVDKNKECDMSHMQKEIKIEPDLGETNSNLEEKQKNDNDLNIATEKMQNKIEQEPLEGDKKLFKNVEDQHEANYLSFQGKNNLSHSKDNEMQKSGRKENTKTFDVIHDKTILVRNTAIPDGSKELICNTENIPNNSDFDTTQSNAIISGFKNNLEDKSASKNDTDNNTVIVNPLQDPNENNTSLNLLAREILIIMYDIIKFQQYNKVLKEENVGDSLKNMVQEEFDKFISSTLTHSWRSVVSQILNRKTITYSFISSVLNKGKVMANEGGNPFNERYFMDILKYFMKQYIIERKESEAERLMSNHNIVSTTYSKTTNFIQNVTTTSKNSVSNMEPMINSANNNLNLASTDVNDTYFLYNIKPISNKQDMIFSHNVVQMTNDSNADIIRAAAQTNVNVLTKPFLREMLSQHNAPYNINVSKNNMQFIRNVGSSTASETQALNVTSPIVSGRTTINNSMAQHSASSSLPSTKENIGLSNTSDKYQRLLHMAPKHRQPPPYYIAIDKQYQYENAHKTNKTPQTRADFSGSLHMAPKHRQPPPYHIAIDKQYQYENAHKTNKTPQTRADFSGSVKENLFRAVPKYQMTIQTDYNITQNQFNCIPRTDVLHPNNNTPHRPYLTTYIPSSDIGYGLTHNSQPQPRGQFSTTPHSYIHSQSMRNSRARNPSRYCQPLLQPVSQTQKNQTYATNQDYTLNYINYEATAPVYQKGVSTFNPEQARSSISRDSGFMSPSTSEQTVSTTLADTTMTSNLPQRIVPNADNTYTTTTLHPCIMCGKSTIQKCSRCLRIYLCSTLCMERAWNTHSYVCGMTWRNTAT